MKKLTAIFLVIAAMLFLGITAKAETYEEYLSEFDYGRDKLDGALPDEVREFLEKEGITPENPQVFSFSRSLRGMLGVIEDNIEKPLKMLLSLCGVILLCAVAESLSADGSLKSVFSAVGALCGTTVAAGAVYEMLESALGAVSAAADFMTVFIPVLTGVSAALGHTLTAAAVNSAVLAATQLFSQLSANFLAPLCGSILGVSAAGAVHPQLKTEKLGELIKKLIVWGLTLVMTVFMGVLSLQTAVSAASDNAAIKTAKFMVSQGVPIIGGTVSEAVNTFKSGLGVLKNGIGVYGIIAAAALMIPALVSLLCYRFAAACAEYISELVDLKALSALMKSCGAIVTIITAVTFGVLLLNTIAAVLTLCMTGGQ